MSASLIYLERDGSGPAALRIQTPASDTRTPTHFIGLIDVSESMSDKNKLANVKHCMSLLMKFLTADDAVSLILFGDVSTILLNRVSASTAQLPVIEQAIRSLEVDGCTNYSAGLASVRQVLDSAIEAGCTLKPGLLTFTDGHANRGIFNPVYLNTMVSRIHDLYPSLSFSFIAYGTDHNAELLKGMADSVMGSYSIVNDIEGAATAMGDSLGGILSCVAQNVVIECPAGSTAYGPYTVGPRGRIVLGDLYAGSDTMILLELPAGPVTFSGVALPSLDPFSTVTPTTVDTSSNLDIDITRLRYKCADLFQQIRAALTRRIVPDFDREIELFRAEIHREALAGHPVTAMLKGELASIEAAIQNIRAGATRGLEAQLTQHQAFTSLLRGTTTSIMPESPHAPRRRTTQSGQVRFDTVLGDPEQTLLSPTSSTNQRRIAELMRSQSQGAHEDDVHENPSNH